MTSINKVIEKSILVIGDVMLDVYYTGDVARISPEAPVPVFRKRAERHVLGGAANVAANLLAAEQKVSLLSVIGNDENGKKLLDIFAQKKIDSSLVRIVPRNTTVKTRFLANNNQQVMRLDVEDTEELNEELRAHLLSSLETKIESFDLIIVSDYLKGLLTPEFTQDVLQLAKSKGIPVVVDVKDPNVEKYKNAFLLKPNKKELHDLTGMQVRNDEEIVLAARHLQRKCNCPYVLATCGARGMVLVSDAEEYFLESTCHEVFDVTGAGDTTIAYLSACIANGFEMKEAVDIANSAAGIQVSKVGTSCVYWSEVRRYLSDMTDETRHKMLERRILKAFRENNTEKKIVFTNGCFDILHIGHVRYLQEAAKLGDMLVVGLNSDASVKRLKGESRPVNSENERAELLCALGFVDYVVIFEEDTPYEIIDLIQPDVLVKGGDYSNSYVVGTDIVEARGGKLVLIPFVEGKSTTNIIEKMKH